DLLLPHGNWVNAPPHRGDGTMTTPYADWLSTVFDRWYSAPEVTTNVRLFGDIIHLLLGGVGGSEQVGLSPTGVLVIETDGMLEQVDALKSAYDGAAWTGLTVFRDSLDSALWHPGIIARKIGLAALSDTCLGCEVVNVCGGGFYPHRYRAGAGFRNP